VYFSTLLSYPVTDLGRPREVQEVETPEFSDSWHGKVASLSAPVMAAFTPQGRFLVLINVIG
jgi:hypothetical protein